MQIEIHNQTQARGVLALEVGLQRAFASAAFMDYSTSHPVIKPALDNWAKFDRLTFELENPNLSGAVRQIPDSYWHDFTKE